MKRLLPIFFLIIGLTACNNPMKEYMETNYKKTYIGVIRTIQEYPNIYCSILLKNEFDWISHVDINDCKNVNIEDKVLITEEVKEGIVHIRVEKLNPNLP